MPHSLSVCVCVKPRTPAAPDTHLSCLPPPPSPGQHLTVGRAGAQSRNKQDGDVSPKLILSGSTGFGRISVISRTIRTPSASQTKPFPVHQVMETAASSWLGKRQVEISHPGQGHQPQGCSKGSGKCGQEGPKLSSSPRQGENLPWQQQQQGGARQKLCERRSVTGTLCERPEGQPASQSHLTTLWGNSSMCTE